MAGSIKTKTLLAAFALAPWLALLGFSHRDEPRAWSLPQWIAWRDAEIQRILAPTFEADGKKILSQKEVIARSAEAYAVLEPFLAKPSFLADPSRGAALGNFAKFVGGQRWMGLKDAGGNPSNLLGMDVADMDYWAYVQDYVRFPDLLRSQEFLKLMNRPATYKEAVEMIEDQNEGLPSGKKWIVLPFRAQFILSVDKSTYGRLLVVVPNQDIGDGKVLDRWIMFAISTPDMVGARVRSVSMVSTVRDEGRPGWSKTYMCDFMRGEDPTGGIAIKPTFLDKNSPSSNCFDCHKSAVLPIHPKAAYGFDKWGKLVEDKRSLVPSVLNALIPKYGESDFGHLEPEGYGPALGSEGRSYSDTFIASATSIPKSSFAAIRANMNCESCHRQFATVNYPLALQSDRDVRAFEAKQGLVQTLIEQGVMPPNNSLSPTERHALWQCLMKAYFDPATQEGQFVDWLRGGP